MSSKNTTIGRRLRGKKRGNFTFKYSRNNTRSNLHVIATNLATAPVSLPTTSKKKPVSKKGAALLVANSKPTAKNSPLAQQNDKSVTVISKDLSISKSDPIQQKKDVLVTNQKPKAVTNPIQQKDEVALSTNQKPKPLSNFLSLQQVDKSIIRKKPDSLSNVTTRQEKEISNVKSNFLALQLVDKSVTKHKPGPSKKVAPQQGKEISSNKSVLPLQHANLSVIKKVPNPPKSVAPHNVIDLTNDEFNSLPSQKVDKSVSGKQPFLMRNSLTQREKERSYQKSNFLSLVKEDNLITRKRPDTSKNLKSKRKVECTFWEDIPSTSRAYFEHEDIRISRNEPTTSRAYLSRRLEEDMYYEKKYDTSRKTKKKKKNYKWQEGAQYPEQNPYTWYRENYKLQQKYHEPYAFEDFSEYPPDEGDFEEVEDFEEVASVEDSSLDPKVTVAVRFHRCIVRYMPYKILSYFKPKWYCISRKRYLVNCCVYLPRKERKIMKGAKEMLIESPLEIDVMSEAEFEGDNEMLEVVADGEITEEDISEVQDVAQETLKVLKVDDHKSLEPNENDKPENSDNGKGNDKSTNMNVNLSEIKIEQNTENVMTSKKKCSSKEISSTTSANDLDCNNSPKKIEKSASSSSPVLILDSPQKTEISAERTEVLVDLDKDDDLPEKVDKNLNASNSKNVDEMEGDTLNKKESPNKNSVSQLSSKEFHKCFSNLDLASDFYQGATVIQSSLDEWRSHLIGLEYMLEIRDNIHEENVEKYYCGLCTEDLPVEKYAGQIVIDHISSYKHMYNYMAVSIQAL